eukprot:GHVU01103114.1.p1 GENE.GHVU01103114.1~~GHVU01103114.1.p1  ORF type:complete len:138 (-),score=1.77 GHVU01103114.1:198-611(-)
MEKWSLFGSNMVTHEEYCLSVCNFVSMSGNYGNRSVVSFTYRYALWVNINFIFLIFILEMTSKNYCYSFNMCPLGKARGCSHTPPPFIGRAWVTVLTATAFPPPVSASATSGFVIAVVYHVMLQAASSADVPWTKSG